MRRVQSAAADAAAAAAVFTLQLLARRVEQLDHEIEDLKQQIPGVLKQHTAELLECHGRRPGHRTTLLIANGQNPDRLRSEASYASLCGVSPLAAGQLSRAGSA